MMTFTWTPHRFSGGALALDVANSVILRFDETRSIDRFALPRQIDGFAEAAVEFCAERALFGELAAPVPEKQASLLVLREATDGYFRDRVHGLTTPGTLACLLEAAAAVLRDSTGAGDLGAATAHSVLRLIAMPEDGRLKICPNCGWLFLDRSKNRSRWWCDMTVCGNRAKASRHYRRSKGTAEP